MVKVTEVTETPETAKMTAASPKKPKDGWTVASEAATITGILGCCILAAGIILSPLILLEANSVWTSIDQEMEEFRDLEAVIWPEMMSLADVESKRFRRQFTALFPDVARVEDSEEAQDRAQPAGDYSKSDYADGGVYYDDDESAAQDAEDYWEEDSPVHRDLVADPNTYRWRKGPGAQPPSSQASRPSPQASRKSSRPSPSRDAWRKGQGVQAPVRRSGEPPALPLESRHGGVLPTDAELAARGHYPPGHPARSAAKAAAKEARQAVLREHEIQFKSDGSIVSKEVDPTAAQVVGGTFNRRPPGIVPLLPQPNVGVLTSIPLVNGPPDGTVQIGLGSYPAGTRRGQPSAPSRRRPYVPGARPPAISLAQPRVRSIPVLAPQPAPPPLSAVLPPPVLPVISSPILPVVAPPPAIAPRVPLVSVQGGLPTFPTRGGQRVPLTPQRRAQLEGNRRLPPELLYLNQFRRRGQFGGPASPINVLAPGFATSGGASGPSPGLPYPPPQPRSPQPPRTLDVFPGSPGSLKLQGQPPRPRPSAPAPAQPPRNPLPPSVQSINPRPPGPDIESFEFPLKAAEEPHEIDLGDPDDYDYEDVEDVGEAPSRLPGSPGSIVSESSKAAPKRTRPDSRIQLPKNTLPDSLKARLSERLGPNAQALPPPPSRASSRPITEERCPAGERGDRGPKGADGEDGENGEPGRPGRAANNYQPTGESPFGGECMRCPQGAPGRKGRQGALGKLGVPGWAGQRGEPGQNGDFGKKGAKGSPGPQGVSGRKGAAGEDAPPVYSVKGPPGRRGRLGPRGDSGDPGLDGPRGFPGGRGGQGAGGFQGRRGLPGPEGRGGRRGPKGPQEYCSCPARKPLILGIIRDQIPNGRFG